MATTLDLLNLGTAFVENVSRARDRGMRRAQNEINLMLRAQQQAQQEFAQEVEMLKLGHELQMMDLRRAMERQRLTNERIRTRNLLMQGLAQGGQIQNTEAQTQEDSVLTNITAEGLAQSALAKQQINLKLKQLDIEEARIRDMIVGADAEFKTEEERNAALMFLDNQKKSLRSQISYLDASTIAGASALADKIITGSSTVAMSNIPAAYKAQMLDAYQRNITTLRRAAQSSPEFVQAFNIEMANRSLPAHFRLSTEEAKKARKLILDMAANNPDPLMPDEIQAFYKQVEEMRKSGTLPDVEQSRVDAIVDRYSSVRESLSSLREQAENALFTAQTEDERTILSQTWQQLSGYENSVSLLTKNISDLRAPIRAIETPIVQPEQTASMLRPQERFSAGGVVSGIGSTITGIARLGAAAIKEVGDIAYQATLESPEEKARRLNASMGGISQIKDAFEKFDAGEITFEERERLISEAINKYSQGIGGESFIVRGGAGVIAGLATGVVSQFRRQPLVVNINNAPKMKLNDGTEISPQTIFESRVQTSPLAKYLLRARNGDEILVSDAATLLARERQIPYDTAVQQVTDELNAIFSVR